MAICKNRLRVTCLFIATLTLLLIHESCCYEKTLRKIVRNQSKMVQRPFSDADTESDFSWRNVSAVEPASIPMHAITLKQTEGNRKERRAKVFKYLSAIDTVRSKSSLTRSSIVRIASTNISHDGLLVRNPFPRNSGLPATPPIEAAEIRHSNVNVFDNINENKGVSSAGGGLSDDYFLSKQPEYFSKEEGFVTKAVPTAVDRNQDNNNSDVKLKSKTKFDIKYSPVEPVDYRMNIDVNDITPVDHYTKKDRRTIYIPVNHESDDNDTIVFKSFYSTVDDSTTMSIFVTQKPVQVSFNTDNAPEISKVLVMPRKILTLEDPVTAKPYSYNVSAVAPVACSTLTEVRTDIDLQEKFNVLELEPQWSSRKTYWSHIFDARYETLMRDSKWPALQVILVPTTHVDLVWKKTFEQYQAPKVGKILSNIVKKLLFYTNMSFSWHEVSHLSQWWSKTSHKNRVSFRRLMKSGRLEITTGGWVQPDEATSHLFGLLHQLMEGHQWLKDNLNYSPKVACLTKSLTHSPTMTYLLAASEIWYATVTNIHYSWEKYLAEYQYSDFLWLQSWDGEHYAPTSLNENLEKLGSQRLPKHAVLTHFLQFNSAEFTACGPNKSICINEFDFAKANRNLGINAYNVEEKAELLLEQYSKSGTISPHNIILAPIGSAFRYEDQTEFDYQYDNYRKLADYINENRQIYKASIRFGTVRDYFTAILLKHKTFPTVQGDFMNYADIQSGKPAYWTGYFTTRPMLKILLRRLQSTLRTAEILFSFAISSNAFYGINVTQILKLLVKARQSVAQFSDRNVDSSTLPVSILKEVYNDILITTKDCWNIQEICASLLTTKPILTVSPVYLQKYVFRDGEFISVFRSVTPGDQLMLFNALGQGRTEVIELISMKPNLKILDHTNQEIKVQINPILRYDSNNIMKVSKRYYKIVFLVLVPAMTLSVYKVTETYSVERRAAMLICSACELDEPDDEQYNFPFVLQATQAGDIQLENYKYRLIFDEFSGFLKLILRKDTTTEKKVMIDFGAFRSSSVNSGKFLFNSDASQPIQDILQRYKSGETPKIIIIISGAITTEICLVFGTLLQHTVRIFNVPDGPLANAISVETKIDMETPPENRDLEIFMSIQTDISNGPLPEIFTDNNGFQYTRRFLNISGRIESNIYPMTTMAYMQDRRSRLTVITDHAQGVTALQEGQITVMMDSRVLFNNGRRVHEEIADSSGTSHKHIILLEDILSSDRPADTNGLPSLTAIQLSNMQNYPIDMYLIDKNQSRFCDIPFLPLLNKSFPCDVSVLNYRAVLTKDCVKKKYRLPISALLVLHRQSFTCQINHQVQLHCGGDSDFFLDRILRYTKGIYKTNLCGTAQGIQVNRVSSSTLPPMELMTVKVNL